MIEDIDRLMERVTWLRDNINLVMTDVLKEYIKEILELNTQKQLYSQGVITTGIKIETFHPYTPLTIKLKSEKGQKISNVTLKDTGEFYANFFINFKEDSFSIGSDDPKAEKLTSNNFRIGFGKEIYGLTDESIEIIRKLVYDKLMEKLYGKIGQN